MLGRARTECIPASLRDEQYPTLFSPENYGVLQRNTLRS